MIGTCVLTCDSADDPIAPSHLDDFNGVDMFVQHGKRWNPIQSANNPFEAFLRVSTTYEYMAKKAQINGLGQFRGGWDLDGKFLNAGVQKIIRNRAVGFNKSQNGSYEPVRW